MNGLIVLLCVAVATARPEFYSAEFDSIDPVIMYNTSPKVFETLTDCFMDTVPCGDLLERLKKILPDAIATACAKCSPFQKHNGGRYFKIMEEKYPAPFEQMKKKYDPENKYFANFLAVMYNA